MSRVCIITSTNRVGSCEATTVMVHCRNALTLHKELGFDLIEGEDDAHKLDQPYDHIICNYASHYMPWQAYFDKIVAQPCARLWWMVNDHDVEDNILLREILKATKCKRTYGVISNNSREGFRQWILRKWIEKDRIRLNDCIDEWHTINLNALTYEDHVGGIPEDDMIPERYPAIYWGSWRKWRLPYFLKYSNSEVFFSTSRKNREKLFTNGCRYSWMGPMTWGRNGTLLRANATIYLEDPHTHENFAFPANRFYEALSYGINILIDESCRKNAEKFGYDDLEYINSVQELLDASRTRTPIPDQWAFRAQEERFDALRQLESIFRTETSRVALPCRRLEKHRRVEKSETTQLLLV